MALVQRSLRDSMSDSRLQPSNASVGKYSGGIDRVHSDHAWQHRGDHRDLVRERPDDLEVVVLDPRLARVHAVPEQVDVLRHRVGVSYEAEAEEMKSDAVIREILNKIEVP